MISYVLHIRAFALINQKQKLLRLHVTKMLHLKIKVHFGRFHLEIKCHGSRLNFVYILKM